MKRGERIDALAELNAIERTVGQRLDGPESTALMAALREAGVLGDADWKQIVIWFREALDVCAWLAHAEPEYNAKGQQIIHADADPRNADWMKIVWAWERIGYKTPDWATLWLWWLGYERPKAFWKRVAQHATRWRIAEDPTDEADAESGARDEKGQDGMNVERVRAAIRKAQAQSKLEPIPNGFLGRPSAYVNGAGFDSDDEPWVVCAGPLHSSSARLLDATMSYKLAQGARYAVAILGKRPKDDGAGPEPREDYLRHYQQVAWSALGIAWVVTQCDLDGQFLADASVQRIERGNFDDIANAIVRRLSELKIRSKPANSRAAEKLIYPAVEAVLVKDFGFERAPKRSYRGFWRRPAADGLWTRSSRIPESFALEVKLDEDVCAPLCQAVEPLGEARAMVYVRMRPRGAKENASPNAVRAKALLEGGAPIRYLNVAYG